MIVALGLAACGGGGALESRAVLADDARAELVGAEASTDDTPAAVMRAARDKVPDRVLGAGDLDDYLFQSAEAALKADANAFGPCLERRILRRSPDFERVKGNDLSVLLRTGAQAAWTTAVTVGGCAAPRRQNLLIITYADQPTAFLPLLPGDTLAGPTQGRQATRIAFKAVEDASENQCFGRGTIRVRTTRQVTPDPQTPDLPGRREDWVVHFCGTDYRVPLTFTGPGQAEGPAVAALSVEEEDLDWPLP
ncbi:MAG: hypothetical protein ACFB6R_08615 [Alphaproteobacteria bacterium]